MTAKPVRLFEASPVCGANQSIPGAGRAAPCEATMQHSKYGKTEEWGWEIDYIKPVVKGGGDEPDNLQPLQWENNRHKGDSYPNWDCKVKE